jgi:hypothetical protein
MTYRAKVSLMALVILASCARDSTERDVSSSTPSTQALPSGSASSTTKGATDPFEQIPDSLIGGSDDEPPPPKEDPTAFSCTPKSFGPRDTLTFRLEVPHGDYLTVVTPADLYFYLVYPQLGDTRRSYSMVPSEDFKTMSTLKVAGDIRLPPRVYGREEIPEAVFSQAGQYLVQMGENLASDYTSPPYICRVTFTP